MAYIRKTIDTWEIQGNCGYGWDTETTEETFKAAREQAKVYRANVSYPIRIKLVREKIEPQA